MQGLMTFAIEQSYELAKLLGRESEVAGWPRVVSRMKAASRRVFYDRREGVVVSGPDRQRSYLGQVWMILSGTLSPREGERALRTVLADPDACYPGSPYAYHYLIEAMIRCGMNEEARRVAYFSATGTTARGAKLVAEAVDGTISSRLTTSSRSTAIAMHGAVRRCTSSISTQIYFRNRSFCRYVFRRYAGRVRVCP